MLLPTAEVLRSVFRLVWPETCAACGTNEPSQQGFCAACGRGLLSLAASDYCPRCGATLGAGLSAGEDGCPSCPQPMPRFQRLVRVGPYAAPLRQAIHRLKYHRRVHAPGHLAGLLAEAVRARCAGDRLDLVLPVPMHWLRQMGRGWNHSAALAAALGRRLDLPVGGELVRVRNTPPQVHLPASRRAANVRDAFDVTSRRNLIRAHVLLVDDVVTTGATANEAARALLKAGSSSVTVAVLAKADAPAAYAEEMDA